MIVSNSSCLIILERLGKLELLQRLYTKIIIPTAVKKEVFRSKPKPEWIELVEIKQPVAPRVLEKNLGMGESEAISLYLELNADLLIIDDLAARKVATELGIRFTGVVGILLEAKKRGLIRNIKNLLDEMLKHDFRISKSVYDLVLEMQHESLI